MSRLTEAHTALGMLAGIAEPGADPDVDELRATETLRAALQRMAQLEKVAKLARVVVAMDDGPFNYLTDCQALENALTELDAS